MCAITGAIYDVAVDLRDGSKTFGEWEGFCLTSEGHELLYIPKGFAHGFLVLENDTIVNYLCGDRYDMCTDGGIIWNDKDLDIVWPIEQMDSIMVSEKDSALPDFRTFCKEHGGLLGGE